MSVTCPFCFWQNFASCAGSLIFTQLLITGWVEGKRWADLKNPGSQGDGSFLGITSGFKPTSNGYPGTAALKQSTSAVRCCASKTSFLTCVLVLGPCYTLTIPAAGIASGTIRVITMCCGQKPQHLLLKAVTVLPDAEGFMYNIFLSYSLCGSRLLKLQDACMLTHARHLSDSLSRQIICHSALLLHSREAVQWQLASTV